MTLEIKDRSSFLNNFLTPVSKVTNSAVFNIKDKDVSTLISTSDNTIILNAKYTTEAPVGNATLNIPDLSKLTRILSVIDKDSVALTLDNNSLSYKSDDVRFKYHLFENGIITVPKLSMDKLNSLQFDGSFTLVYADLMKLIKGSSIATDTNKIYLTYRDNTVIGELTDKARPNVDSYGMQISIDYKGPQLALATPLNFETFRIISSMRFKELKCSFSTKVGVYIFETKLTNTDIKFVVSALAN
jgi:hypothetical protein